jgi:hypothetical protein
VKTNIRFSKCATVALGLIAVVLAGCWKDRVVWSPDGTRAAILTRDGLHFAGADGSLSSVIVSGGYRAAWLADSQRLVFARSRGIKDFAALAAALGPERTRLLEIKAEAAWQQLLAGVRPDDIVLKPADDVGALLICLRHRHHDQLREKLAKDWESIENAIAEWHSVVVARIAGDRLEELATLAEGLAEVHDLRVSPGNFAVAFVTRLELSPVNDNGLAIFVAPIDGSAPATVVATHTAAHPDWTPDGRTLVFLQTAGDQPASDELRLGALVERQVLDSAGHVQVAKETRDLAGLIFQDENRVRCLRDGRVIFDAAEFHLPLAGSDRKTREQLFALDRSREGAALVPLIPRAHLEKMSNALAFFDVSPDEKQVLFGGGGTDLDVLTLSSGNVERLALGIYENSDKSPPLPVWRGPGEIVYLKKGAGRNELMLHRQQSETILSRTWSDAVLQGLIE